MSLSDEVLALMRARGGNPDFIHLSNEALAICDVLERRLANKQLREIATRLSDDGIQHTLSRVRP